MDEPREPSGTAIGFTLFAGMIMIIVGIFGGFQGLVAIIKKEFFAVSPNYIFTFDVTTWGWIHLILGVIVVFAGIGLYSGAVWARTVGVVMAALHAIDNFFFLPIYPVWSILMIALDVIVIWALTAHGRDITEV